MSRPNDNAEMETGNSLAEGVWTSDTVLSTSKHQQQDDQTTSRVIINKSKSSSTTSSLSIEEAWTKIHELRSKLSNDIISDPSPPSDNNNNKSNNVDCNKYNLPTFISPYEQPKLKQKSQQQKKSSKQKYKGMAIPLVYCDQTASQRPVHSIERYLQEVSMPCYANTHTVRLSILYLLFVLFYIEYAY